MLAPLTDEWIEEQLKLCEAATPEPWMLGWPGQQWPMARRCISNCDGKSVILAGTDQHGYYPTGIQTEADGLFIIAARAGYMPLLLAFRSLRKEVVQCPCCTEFYVRTRGEDGLCPECEKEATDASSE